VADQASQSAEVVLITGANSGIGLHMLEALLKNGYRVAALDVEGERILDLCSKYPDSLIYCRGDVTDEQETAAAVKEVQGTWGRIDILVNNACIAALCPLRHTSLGQVRHELEVNYLGYLRLITAVLPIMVAQGGGIIHNMSSGVGVTGFPGLVGYTSSKGAIEAMARTLALELAEHGIRVTVMHPPLTRTASTAPLPIPPQMMADPRRVGRLLARKITSTRSTITPDWQTWLQLTLSRAFPHAMGRLLARLTRRSAGRETSK